MLSYSLHISLRRNMRTCSKDSFVVFKETEVTRFLNCILEVFSQALRNFPYSTSFLNHVLISYSEKTSTMNVT